jgi:hypothetical protein
VIGFHFHFDEGGPGEKIRSSILFTYICIGSAYRGGVGSVGGAGGGLGGSVTVIEIIELSLFEIPIIGRIFQYHYR